jgi:hypothetical protein
MVMFDNWTEIELEQLAEQCDLPTIPQTTRNSAWSDDWDHGDLVNSGSVLPNDIQVTRLRGRLL